MARIINGTRPNPPNLTPRLIICCGVGRTPRAALAHDNLHTGA